MAEVPPNPIEKPGYRLEFHDEFDGHELDTDKWLPFYLPQWSSAEASAARYHTANGALELRIEEDQPPWCPEWDGPVRVSNLQTGVFSGPEGSAIGQHRFRPACIVRTFQSARRTYVPRYGYFEFRASASLGPQDLAAVWMIGFEDTPENSGEITICEIFGKAVRPGAAVLGHGIKPVNDPRLRAGDFHEDEMSFDPAGYHIYAAEWTPAGVDFFLDNRRLRHVAQSPGYPMQFMLNVYELEATRRSAASLPRFSFDYFRAYQPEGGYQA